MNNNKELTVFKLSEIIRKNNGFTLDLINREFVTTGYAVSIFKELETKIEGHATAIDIASFIYRNYVMLHKNFHCLGAWFNPADGFTYLDVSVVYPNETAARELAIQHNQLAIFNLDTCETIEVSNGQL